MTERWLAEVQEDEFGEPYIILPPDVLEYMNLKEDDTVSFEVREGKVYMKKIERKEDNNE